MRLCVLCGELQTQPIMTKILITVFLGGGLGSLMRYGVQAAMHGRISPFLFPWATLSVNILGSFLIGMFYVNVLCPLRPIQFVRRDAAFPHHGALRRIHHLFHVQPRGNDAHPPRQLRNLLALCHPKCGIGRGGGFRRRLGRNNASRERMIYFHHRGHRATQSFLIKYFLCVPPCPLW